MTRTLIDTSLEQVAVEHYLFDLEYSVEKVSEIFGMSEDTVKKIHDDYKASFSPRSSKLRK